MKFKTIEELFLESEDPKCIEYKGMQIYRLDLFPVKDKGRIKIIWESTNSKWRQAVQISADKKTVINGEKGKIHVFWLGPTNKSFVIEYQTGTGFLEIENAWDVGDGTTLTGLGNGGMIIEELENGRRYRCNDGYPDDDFDDLIFRVERIVP